MRDRERGSVLLLMPAAVLIFIVLGALCVDFGAAYGARRELLDAAAAAASDAANEAVDLGHLYETGEVRLLADRARAVAEQSVAAKGLERLDAQVVEVVVDGRAVMVTVRGRVHYLFAEAVPGGPEGTDIEVTAEVDATELDG